MRALLLLLPIAPLLLGDVGLKQGNTVIGPVRDISCANDGGLLCVRDAGTAIGALRCNSATATEPGCITPAAQTMAGAKTWTGRQRLVGVAHGSLTACSSGEKGTWQTCATHNSPVFCDGTTNHELLGANNLAVLPGFYVNGLLHARSLVLHTFTLPFAFTITQTSGFIGAGTGTGSLNIRYSDGSNYCDCPVDCDSDQLSVTCSGNCSYAASTTVIAAVSSDGCDTPPTIKGLLTPAGYY